MGSPNCEPKFAAGASLERIFEDVALAVLDRMTTLMRCDSYSRNAARAVSRIRQAHDLRPRVIMVGQIPPHTLHPHVI